VHLGELEVIWPRHKSDYLFVPHPELVNMETVEAPLSPPIAAIAGRETVRHTGMPKALAARALLGAECSQQRAADLIGSNRRTLGRMVETDLTTALRNPQALERARTCLEDTAGRGSTAEERAAAVAWLTVAARDEHQVEAKPVAVTPRVSTSRPRKARGPARRPTRTAVTRHGAATSTTNTSRPDAAPRPPAALSPAACTRDQMDGCGRLHRRIRVRADVIRRLLEPETTHDDLLDIVLELLVDIRADAEALDTLHGHGVGLE
jgi:hypothetical protein